MADTASLKQLRRTSKAKFTRKGNAVQYLLDEHRGAKEVEAAFAEYETAFSEVSEKHDCYAASIDDDDDFDSEAAWMDEVQKTYLSQKIKVKDFLNSSTSATLMSDDSPREAERHAELTPESEPAVRCRYKVEMPKLPSFTGEVRDYLTFRTDFLHMVDGRYSKRDAITMLRASLKGKPLEMIRGIGADFDAALDYLDSVYGDPRFISDAVVNDLNKFKSLRDGEDGRFCDLVHLVRRSYNTLKEIGRPQDMDNTQILSLIEKKLNQEDRKVWFRHLDNLNVPADLTVLIDWLTREMKSRMRAIAPIRSECSTSKSGAIHHVGQHDGTGMPAQQPPRPAFHKCWLCETSTHWLDQCRKFLSMSPTERLKLLKESRACFSCMKKAGKDHRMSNCRRRRLCTETVAGEPCKSFHHPLLHASTEVRGGAVDVAFTGSSETLLPVVTADLMGKHEERCSSNVLLDSGAQVSLIKKSVADELNLMGKNINITITKVGGQQEEIETKRVQVKVKSLSSQKIHSISAVALPCISEDIAEVNISELACRFKLNKEELRRGTGSLHLLIGIDHPKLHVGKTVQKGNLVARKSPLGWVIFGGPNQSRDRMSVLHVKLASPIDLTDFWSSESMGVQSSSCQCEPSPLSKQERMEEQIIRQSSRKVGNQWEIPYPWRKNPDLLPDNRAQAEKVLQSTEKRLARNPEHADAYDKQMKELVQNGFARRLTDEELAMYEGPVHYISYHAILRPEKKSTPVRIVFNAYGSYHGHCLNDYWMKGPDLLNVLLGVLLRFRLNEVGVCADISKMYHRVSIPERDRHVHRYLWRKMQTERRPDVYMMKVVTFGDKPAPAMAQLALRMTAELAESRFPEAAKVLKDSVYMDDICDSVKSVAEAEKLTSDIDQVLENGGFKVKGWSSNECLRGESRKEEETSLVQAATEDKVLGIAWDNQKDLFSYKVKDTVMSSSTEGKDEEGTLTKRKILSRIARIFDPIGFASPFLVRAKIGMQQLWQKGYGWDEVLPPDQQSWWVDFMRKMQDLNAIRFERCLTPPMIVGNPTLCIFADASEVAFGACAYLRWELQDGNYAVRFVLGKSRVAPLKKLTIPRLELQAAVMAARLYTNVMKELKLQPKGTVFMTDSMITLAWIRSEGKRFKPFVAARVGEIQSQTDPAEWRHVPGELNPADDVSRGLSVKSLSERWKQGPMFLYRPEEEWPPEKPGLVETEVEVERRRVHHLAAVMHEDVIDVRKFSNWRKLLRVTAYFLRFVQKIKTAHNGRSGNGAQDRDEGAGAERTLTQQEMQKAKAFLIKEAQTGIRSRVEKGDSKTLSPFTDKEGIVRVGGRTDESLMSYEMKHPALLPNDHWISTLITRHMHELGHSGVAATMAKIRRYYWILHGHKLAKTEKFRCVSCRKSEHKVETQMMANLPIHRVAPFTPPFHYTSTDYFGPYKVKIGRNKTTKYYGVIFTCLNTRAVHLELACDCSTMELLQTLRRFFCSKRTASMHHE